MSETKHTTNLEIRASTQGIKDVGKELRGAFDPKLMAAFASSVDKMSSSMEGLVEMQQRLVDLQKQTAREGAAGAAAIVSAIHGRGASDKAEREEKARKQAEKQAERQAEREQTNRRRMMMAGAAGAGYLGGRMAGGASNAMASATRGPGLAEGLLGMIPFIGSGLAGTVGALRNYSGMAEGAGSARGGAFGQTGNIDYGMRTTNPGDTMGDDDPTRLSGHFARHGLSLMDAPGMMAGYGQSTGLRGGELQSLAPALLDMQRGMGLNSAGSIVRANMTGGGTSSTDSSMKAMRDAIAAGLTSGISEGRLDEYLADIAQNVEAARTEGISLTSESLTTLVSGFAAMGLRGQTATHAATTMAGSMRNLGEDTSFASQVALRIAMAGDERTGGTGPRGYEEALAYMESNPDAMVRAQLGEMRNLSGGSRGVLAGNIRRGMPGLSRSESWALSGAEGGGEFAGVTDADRTTANGLIDERAEQARQSAGASRHRASLTNSGIAIGNGGAGNAIRNLEGTEMGVAANMASALAGPMTSLANTARDMLSAFNSAGGGMAGFKAILMDVLGPLVGNIASSIGNSVRETVEEALPDNNFGNGARMVMDTIGGGPVAWEGMIRSGFIAALQSFFGHTGGDIARAIIRLSEFLN